MWNALAEAAPQVPALVVLAVLVVAFLKFLKGEREAIKTMVDSASKVANRCSDVIEDNSKVQGQVLEALHKANGKTFVEVSDGDAA